MKVGQASPCKNGSFHLLGRTCTVHRHLPFTKMKNKCVDKNCSMSLYTGLNTIAYIMDTPQERQHGMVRFLVAEDVS